MLRPAFPIKTRRLVLRPFAAGDLDAVLDYQGREDVARYLLWGPLDREAARKRLLDQATRTELVAEGDRLSLACELDGLVIGDVVLFYSSVEHRGVEIGWVFHPDHHGRGYATEAATELLRLAFDELGAHRVTARLDADNAASAALCERLGMRREALFVKNEVVRGRWTSEAVYALLDEEWAGRQAPPG
ncbi:GNAT family N-acetyltransferase [Actinokineospora bangkokensis]|uniref:GNAT family N-acetyltransferase n=1 Tax=Actinokineospora bangkokensis TaxID=1193682 RepID=A0A1Q9LER8_9PSEU|nr:GNAT family N-acetyltransferase [Actinokineospora bangkokensis]OLR90532.1 GNAT family N-acetyltransferase [Actinokineospora bangkokensis]